MGLIRNLLLFALLPAAAIAQGPFPGPGAEPAPDKQPVEGKPAEEKKPAVEKLDENRYRIGDITIDKRTREIRFPAKVNMTEGLLEFLLVHSRGKIHESLFATEISPTQLNVAFTLLRFKPSRELQAEDAPAEHEAGTKFPKVPDDVKAGARVDIRVEWKDKDEVRSVFVNEWICHSVTEKPMSVGPWVYSGSEISNGRFQAEATGDIVSIFLTNSALVGYPGKDNSDDEAWLAQPKRVPPIGTDVTLVITPHTLQKPATKP